MRGKNSWAEKFARSSPVERLFLISILRGAAAATSVYLKWRARAALERKKLQSAGGEREGEGGGVGSSNLFPFRCKTAQRIRGYFMLGTGFPPQEARGQREYVARLEVCFWSLWVSASASSIFGSPPTVRLGQD